MADLNIRNIDVELLRRAKVAAVESDQPLRQWVMALMWAAVTPGTKIVNATMPRAEAEMARPESESITEDYGVGKAPEGVKRAVRTKSCSGCGSVGGVHARGCKKA